MRQKGLTLLELLTVIVILSLMMGISISLFTNANKDLGVRASANHVISLIRSVRDHSRIGSEPAWVVLNPAEGSIHALTQKTYGEWHFEDTDSTGAFGRNANISKGTLVPGRIGMAVSLSGSGSVDCGVIPIFAPDQGLSVEFWYYRINSSRSQTLFTIGDQAEMKVSTSGKIISKLGDLTLSSGKITLRTAEVWYHVHLVHNGREMQLFLNGTRVAGKAGTVRWTREDSLVIGASRGGIRGIIDEFRIGLIFAREKHFFPKEVSVELAPGLLPKDQKEFLIHFDSEGRLDSRKHSQPIRFKVKSTAHESEITIYPTGVVER